MAERGFKSVYVKRPSVNVSSWSGRYAARVVGARRPCPFTSRSVKHDGCGIFFRETMFRLEATETLNYDDTHDRVALMVH